MQEKLKEKKSEIDNNWDIGFCTQPLSHIMFTGVAKGAHVGHPLLIGDGGSEKGVGLGLWYYT